MTGFPTRRSGDDHGGTTGMQRLRKGNVHNLTEFGRALRRHAIRELAWFAEETEHGFMDGGCRMLAQALVDWTRGDLRLSALVRTGEKGVQHYAATDGFIHLDGDGAATAPEIVRKLAVVECCPGCEVVLDQTGLTNDQIPYDPMLVTRLRQGLEANFGPWIGSWMKTEMRDVREKG